MIDFDALGFESLEREYKEAELNDRLDYDSLYSFAKRVEILVQRTREERMKQVAICLNDPRIGDYLLDVVSPSPAERLSARIDSLLWTRLEGAHLAGGRSPLSTTESALVTNAMTPVAPSWAVYLFYILLDAPNCDALVGDLEERYRLIRRKFGKRRADFWYWTQAVRSVGPIAWVWVKRHLLKPVIAVIAWAFAKGIIGHDSWLAALMELYRRIRS